MIQLYGLKMSNYYSLVKALLIEKGVDFEEVKAPPTQEEDNLSRSPMGKMPSIGVDGNYMSESLAIAAYLDRVQPEPALLPSDPFAAGKVIELVCHMKLDVELVARRCLPEAFFGQTVSDETKSSTQKDLAKGMAALDRIYVGAPYAAGADLTLADFYTYFSFGLAGGIAQKMFDTDLIADYPKIQGVMARMAEHPSVQRVEAEKA
ncbi:MAG: glutathione S-transferase [Pseudomonadales bacterium]|nr:glutathione S-transferase [Pseudomonadales bacterium]